MCLIADHQSYENLEAALTKDEQSDINANDLYVELKFVREFIPKKNLWGLLKF
jgi:hypothetical protein